jgi:outer membrane protein W
MKLSTTIALLILISTNYVYAQKYQISFVCQNGQHEYPHDVFGARKRSQTSQYLIKPPNFFEKYTALYENVNPYLGTVSTSKIIITQKNADGFTNMLSFVKTQNLQVNSYVAMTPLQIGDTESFIVGFSENQNQLFIGKNKLIMLLPNKKLWLNVGIDGGIGYSSATTLMAIETIVKETLPYDLKVQRIVLLPIYSLNVQIPIGVQYYWRKHWLIEANFNRNFSVIRPLKKNMGNTFKERHSQTLFGFGVGYRFDKLPVRKK